jgi:hypothetical protein
MERPRRSKKRNQLVWCPNPLCPLGRAVPFTSPRYLGQHFVANPQCDSYNTMNNPLRKAPPISQLDSTSSKKNKKQAEEAPKPPKIAPMTYFHLENLDTTFDNNEDQISISAFSDIHSNMKEKQNTEDFTDTGGGAEDLMHNEQHARPPFSYDTSTEESHDGLHKWLDDWLKYTKQENTRRTHKYGEPPDQCDFTENDGCPNCCGPNKFHQLPDETKLIETLMSDPNFSAGWKIIQPSEIAEIALLKRLNRIKGCPLSVYDDVLEWVREFIQDDANINSESNIIPLLRSRDVVMRSFGIRSHCAEMEPTTTNIKLVGGTHGICTNHYYSLFAESLPHFNRYFLDG